MSWYKKPEQKLSLSSEDSVDWKGFEDKLHRMYEVGAYAKPYNRKKQKDKTPQNGTPCHSLDPHCDGGDDGW